MGFGFHSNNGKGPIGNPADKDYPVQNVYDNYDYYDSIFKGTQYYDMYLNNPYITQLRNLRPSFWDKVSDAFGIHSDYYKNQANLSLQADAYTNDLLQKLQQDKYNSAPSQAQRERAAGLNPDLVGLSNPVAASEMDMQRGSENGMFANDHSITPMNIFSGVMQCIDFGLGVADKFIGMRSDIIANDTAELQLNDVLSNVVNGTLLPQINSADYNAEAKFHYNPKSGNIVMSFPNENFKDSDGNIGVISDKSLTFSVPKKFGPRLSKMLGYIYNSPEFKERYYNSRNASNVSKTFLGVQNAGKYNLGDYKLEDSLLKCCQPLAKVMDLEVRNSLSYLQSYNPREDARSVNAQNRYNRMYYDTADGVSAGKAFNANNKEITDMKETRNKALSALRKCVDDLYNLSLNGNRLERVGAMGTLMAIGTVILQPLNITSHSTTSGNSRTGKYSDSKSFGIGFK